MEERVNLAVLFEERVAHDGTRIGIATLNVAKTLNALSLDMIGLLTERLTAWASDPGVALVMLEGAGDKAFCAGGDLRDLYDAMQQHHASPQREDIRANAYALEFFTREYRLDYMIHTYPKPILCWAHGIVLGGGVGLMSGASHRVVTERSRIAMPEITVGLYPDVGGSWLLERMPGKLGLFLGLTGAPLTASDAIFAGIADYQIPHARKAEVVDLLLHSPWSHERRHNDILLSTALRSAAQRTLKDELGPARRNFDVVNELCGAPRLLEIIAGIIDHATDDPWLEQAAAALAAGSPSSAALTYALRQRVHGMSLADSFRMELTASLHCAARPDFMEGIRALIVDKDRKPRWSPAMHSDVTREWVDEYFVSPWRASGHPLAALGAISEG